MKIYTTRLAANDINMHNIHVHTGRRLKVINIKFRAIFNTSGTCCDHTSATAVNSDRLTCW